jgi:hypothetical protein
MTTYKTLAIVNDVSICDCCGKSNLLRTVAMERDDGEILHFGTVCATRHSGRSEKDIKSEAATELYKLKEKARSEMQSSMEEAYAQARMAKATHEGIRPGKPFMEFCKAENAAAAVKRAEIAAKYNLPAFSF